MKKPGAAFQRFKVLIEMGDPADDGRQLRWQKIQCSFREIKGAPERPHVAMQLRCFAAHHHQALAFATVALFQHMVFDQLKFAEEAMQGSVERIGVVGEQGAQQIQRRLDPAALADLTSQALGRLGRLEAARHQHSFGAQEVQPCVFCRILVKLTQKITDTSRKIRFTARQTLAEGRQAKLGGEIAGELQVVLQPTLATLVGEVHMQPQPFA